MIDRNLVEYINESYSPELGQLLLQSCDLFEQFGVEDYEFEMLDLIMTTAYEDRSTTSDRLIFVFRRQLDRILEAHKVDLSEEARFSDVVVICDALYRIQHLDNYLPIINVLEGFRSDEEQFADIIGSISELEDDYILTILDEVASDTMAKLKQFALSMYERDHKDEQDDKTPYINVLKILTTSIGDNAAAELVKSGLLVGAGIRTYLSYFSELLVSEDNKQTALNVLGLILVSEEGINNPLGVYRKISHYLFNDDLNHISAVEAQFVGLLSQFNEYKRITGMKV